MKKYYALSQNGKEASIMIYGDISSWDWYESDVSSYTLAKELDGIDADIINVYINSYGGEVAEGLAIYNALRRHKAKIRTVVDGFACSIASVIFMAGDERIMNPASLLMIHNPWTWAAGNASEFRKQADDLDVIAQASINAYMAVVSIPESDLKDLLNNETWIPPSEALEKGFATAINPGKTANKASQSARQAVYHKITAQAKPLQAEVRITDLCEFKQMFAAMQEQISALKPQQAPPQENTTIDFLNAMIGRKG